MLASKLRVINILAIIPVITENKSRATISFNGKEVTTTRLAGGILDYLIAQHRQNPHIYTNHQNIAVRISCKKNSGLPYPAAAIQRELSHVRYALGALGIRHWLDSDRQAGERWVPRHLPPGKPHK